MDKNKKILVLFTGGTIGSVRVFDKEANQYIYVQPSQAKRYDPEAKDLVTLLLTKYYEKFPNHFSNFETKSIMETFSEDSTTEVLSDLTRKIKSFNLDNYKGIIITHGTDTLAYTANYLATVLNQVKVPVMLVSSNYSVDQENKANGVINFKAAIDFINDCEIPGVYVSYCNNIYTNSPETNIIYASRVTQCQNVTDTFNGISIYKPEMLPLASVSINGQISIEDKNLFGKLQSKYPNGNNLIKKVNRIDSRVLMINPYVGMNYDFFDLNSSIDSVLHTFYHSGTACTDGKESSKIQTLIKMCEKKGIPLYLGPTYGKSNKDIYATSQTYSNQKIIMNTSVENAYIKLLIANAIFNRNKKIKDIDEFVFSDINEEHICDPFRLQKKL